VLNFVNGLSKDQALEKVNRLIDALAESSRYHGFENPSALPFLFYEIAKFVDLTDRKPLLDPLDGNSSKYPRVPNWKEGINFQYRQLFLSGFRRLYGVPDPRTPDSFLSLEEMVDYGFINEVWFLAKQGKYGAPFESIELKQAYDGSFRKIEGKM